MTQLDLQQRLARALQALAKQINRNAELYAERDALQQQVNALAAESLVLKNFGDKLNDMHKNLNGEGTGIQGRAEVACQQIALEAAMEEFDAIKTPETDAIKRQWMAEGAMKVADSLLRMVSVAAKRDKETILSLSRKAEAIAEQIRQPEEKGQ